MENPYQSPAAFTCPVRARSSPRWARIGILLLILGASWFVSVLSFYIEAGFLPRGAGDLLVGPLVTSLVTLPASFGGVLADSFRWLPAGLSDVVLALGAIAFWPCYTTFLVLTLRTGRRKYFAFFGVLSLLASIHWHLVSFLATHG